MAKEDPDGTGPVDFYQQPVKEMMKRAGGPERLLRAILEASESPVFVKDGEGTYILANPAFARLFHRPLAEILGKTDADLFPREEAEALRGKDRRVMKTGKPLRSLDRLTVDGRERVFLATKIPFRDAAGDVIGLLGFADEITEEVRTRDQLAHLNQVLRAIRSVNQLITKAKDRDQLLQQTCELLIETRGYRSAWIVLLDADRSFSRFYHAGLSDAARSMKERFRQGRIPECFRRALARGGVVTVADRAAECGDCPLLGKAPDQRELTARLEYNGAVYGVLSVSLPRGYVELAEEQSLVKEVAGDLAFALHELEAEEARRQAEEALQESESRFRSIVETSHSGILVVDEDYRLVYVNDQGCRMLGLPREEIIGRDFREFLDEESRALVAERYRRRQAGEKVPPRYEFNVVRKDGEKRRVEISSTVVRDPTGEVRTIAQILDITERARLQQRLDAIDELTRTLILLRDENAIIEHVLEAAKSLLGMTDCAAYLIDEKKKKLMIAGYTKDVPVRYKEMDLFSEKGIIPAVARSGEAIYLPDVSTDKRYLRGRSETRAELCVPIKGKDKVFGVLNAERPKIDGFSPADRRLLATLADSTAVALENLRLNAETVALKKFNERIVTSLNEGIILEDATGTISYVNPAAAKMLGYSSEDLVGKTWTTLVPEDKRDRIKKRMEERRAGASERYETRLITKNGGRHPVLVSARPLFDDGRFTGVLSVLTDITARLKSEKALKESYARVQRALHGIVEALEAAIELRDPYTAGHQMRVAELAVAIGREMNLSSDAIDGLRYAALVHDIGKLAVPAEILAKPSSLRETEFAIIKAHPQQAYDILKGIDFPWPVADIVLQHHERLDGSGYPQGLKDGEIMLEARILAVADVVEAMSSHRPYRPALGIETALSEIKKGKGRLYDPAVVEACLSVFQRGFTFAG